MLHRGKSALLLGPRQTGKTTLIEQFSADLKITLLISKIRRQYEMDPDRLIREVEALIPQGGGPPFVIIDEIQKVPALMDSVQYLIDRKLGQFLLTGSSARKLCHGKHINLLPGRVIGLRLDPLMLEECETPLPPIENLLIYGALPAIFLEKESMIREEELESYVDLYLEEEIRAEALVRDIGSFEKFLRLAAVESGNLINFDKLSQEIGVARTTIAGYYQILEDCLIAERIEPYTESTSRKRLTKSPKYLFFDLGLRRVAAGESTSLPQRFLGSLFEQFVGLELLRLSRLNPKPTSLHFWRDSNGPEVDWVVKQDQSLIPIEVKWTENPSLKDVRHLEVFLREYPEAKNAYLVCQVSLPQKLGENILALPWQNLNRILAT